MECETRMDSSAIEARSPRLSEIVSAAMRILESNGREALTMRRLAAEIGIQAPSLYKHTRDKAHLEALLIAEGFIGLGSALESSLESGGEGSALARMVAAYRNFALAHPHLYRLLTEGRLPRESLPEGLESRTALPLTMIAGGEDRARAIWAFAHGMIVLELDGRFPPSADLDAAWEVGLTAFEGARMS